MSETPAILRRILSAPKDMARWYLSPVGLLIFSLVAVALAASIAGFPGVGVVALAVVLGIAVPYKFVRERADSVTANRLNSVALGRIRSEVTLRPTSDELEATKETILDLRRATRQSIQLLRGRLTAVHERHVRYAESTNIEVAEQHTTLTELRTASTELRTASTELRTALTSRSEEIAEVRATIDGLKDLVGELQLSQDQLLAQVQEERHAIVSDGSSKHFFLAAGYRRRSELTANFDDTANEDNYQREVYDYALGVAHQSGAKRICDFGCGSAFKLMKRFGNFETVGIDVPSTVEFLRRTYPDRTWHETGDLTPELFDDFDVVIASDVIEHLQDPSRLLDALARSSAKNIVLSTPARELLMHRGDRPLGPPGNPHHYLEWTTDEFATLVSSYLDIVVQHISNESQATQLVHARVR